MNKNLIVALWLAFFVVRHDTGQDVYLRFDGLTQEQISAMYQKDGTAFDFIDEATYSAYVATHQNPTPPTAAELAAYLHSAGITAFSAQSDYGILHRAVADVSKDEFNDIRRWIMALKAMSAAPTTTSLAAFRTGIAGLPNLPDRNLGQLKTAITDRINSGNVDQ